MGIEKRVRFTGMVPYNKIAAYLKMADVFVTASITEVHPLSVIEAMAAGLPVLGIQSPGIGDSVEDGVSGLLCPEEDLAAFTAKMVRLITDSNSRRDMGDQARRFSQRYAIENTTQIMVGHYQHLERQSQSQKRSLRMRLIHMLDRWR
jgi:glycosyltransferase involved in cell wall biosynthesis